MTVSQAPWGLVSFLTLNIYIYVYVYICIYMYIYVYIHIVLYGLTSVDLDENRSAPFDSIVRCSAHTLEVC